MAPPFRWQVALWLFVIVLALVSIVRSDRAHLDYVSEFSMQGSPAPAMDEHSPTGYALGQRHFLGLHERGETYRWIAATQAFIGSGPFASPIYTADTVPTGRPQLLPKLYTAWLAVIAWSLHVVTGDSVALSAERAALWEPLISHLLACIAGMLWMGRRHGLAGAAATALGFAFYLPLSGQFLPGVLTARTWALLLAAYSLALLVRRHDEEENPFTFRIRAAIASGLALWLDPAFGFPAVLLTAAAGASALLAGSRVQRSLRWSIAGSGLITLAWLVDRAPFSPAAGELRYVHPLYAFAWLGLGFLLDGAQSLRARTGRRALRIAELATGALLVSTLAYVQLTNAYAGWLYPSVWLRRLTSLDETTVFDTLTDWLASASALEVLFVTAVPLAAAALLATAVLRPSAGHARSPLSRFTPLTLLFAGLCVIGFFRVRWGVVAGLVALPVIGQLAARDFAAQRRLVTPACGLFFAGLIAWAALSPGSFQRPTPDREASAADLEALVHRHFSHWLATHTPERSVAALAPPELSDSIIFHGGGRALMSTSWESYPGQVAATRILSAIEATEAEAVLQGHELTHVILPSWDKVLPLFVQKPSIEGKDTLFERLDRWVAPPYLRPIPYRLPPMPAFAAVKLAVFAVTPPQDAALSLSRLAEYFVEMDREEPAGLAARVLAESFPSDPNAAIARALVSAGIGQQSALDELTARLADDVAAGRTPADWDRRVQRAIVLALARRHDLARAEIAACLVDASRASLFELTPLQAYRLRTLVNRYGLSFASAELRDLADTLGGEYGRPGK